MLLKLNLPAAFRLKVPEPILSLSRGKWFQRCWTARCTARFFWKSSNCVFAHISIELIIDSLNISILITQSALVSFNRIYETFVTSRFVNFTSFRSISPCLKASLPPWPNMLKRTSFPGTGLCVRGSVGWKLSST